MAIPTSPDWYLAASFNSSAHKPNSSAANCTTLNSVSKSLLFLSLHRSCRNPPVFLTNSTPCPSPILEDTPTNPQLLKSDPSMENSQLFASPDSKDLNSIICSLFEDPQTEELAHTYYEKAKQKQGFKPNEQTLNLLVRYSIRTKNWGLIISFCEDFKIFKLLPGRSSCCRLISFCVAAKKFKLVNNLLEVFKTNDKISIFAFDSAMKGYNKLHMYSSTIIVYSLMKSGGIALDPVCYCRVMEAYMKTSDYEAVVSLFHELQEKGINSTLIFRKIYRILIQSLGKLSRAFEALEYFRDMSKKGIQEDHLMYSSLIGSFMDIREIEVAEELCREAEDKRMLKDPALFLKLVLVYIEEGMLEKVMEVVSTMKRSKIRVSDCIICAIVNGYSKKRGLRAAIMVYESLRSQGCEPGQVTYASVINVYYRLGYFSEAEKVFSEMQDRGFHKCVVAYSNMVAIYSKAGRVRDAMRLVAKMKEKGCEPNVWVYNSLLDMHGRALNLRQVEKTWKEMKRRKISPDKVSYTSVIGAYNKAREFENCVKYYYEYRLNGGTIDRALAGIMVGVFSKLNKVDELVKLLRDLKTEGTRLDARLYRSAMDAITDAGLFEQAKWLQQSFAVSHDKSVYFRKR